VDVSLFRLSLSYFISGLIKFRQLYTGVIIFENPIVSPAYARQSKRADLTHANAVTPAATYEGEAYDVTCIVVASVNDEELFAQTQDRTYATAAKMSSAVRADYFKINGATR